MAPDLAQPWLADFPSAATPEDIYYCFRLLLGRKPQSEEWPGHLGGVGTPLKERVRAFVNCLEFNSRGMLERGVGGVRPVRFSDFTIFVDPADPEIGAHIVNGAYEPHVTQVFRRLLRPGDGVIDIGANIGFFTMLAADLVGPGGSVLAIEPLAQNVKLLEASRRANRFDHAKVVQVAASDRLGLLALYASSSTNGATSGLSDEVGEILASHIVPCMEVDRLTSADVRTRLIKMDVEGSEGLAMRGARETIDRDRPFIVAEFSPEGIEGVSGISARTFLGMATARDYDVYVITDSDLDPCSRDHDAVLQRFADAQAHHVDLLMTPAESVELVEQVRRDSYAAD